MTALFVVFILIAFGIYKGIGREQSEIITVGIVSDESDFVMGALIDMVKDIPSLSSFCRMEQMSNEEAMEGIASGDIGIAIVVPGDFYETASAMQEAHIEIYAPAKETVAGNKLLAIIEGVEQLMVNTEGSLYAMYDGMAMYSFPVGTAEMEYTLFMDEISRFMGRDEIFEDVWVSPFGNYTYVQFYVVSILITVISISSVSYFKMYSSENRQIERMIGANTYGKVLLSISKIVAITLPTGIFVTAISFLARAVAGRMGMTVEYTHNTFVAIWLVVLSISILINMIVAVAGADVHTRTLYWLIIGIMLAVTGVIVPAVYLPEVFSKISHLIPVYEWQEILLRGIWDYGKRVSLTRNIKPIAITDVIFLVIGVFAYCRRLNGHD